NRLGESVKGAFVAFQNAANRSLKESAAYQAYLDGFAHSAEGVITVATIVRDISFAAAVSIAVVVAAPVIVARPSTAATALGLTGEAATVVAGGVTVVGSGAVGAALEGGGQAAAELIVQTGELIAALADPHTTWQQAIDHFSFREIGAQGWDGMK